MPIPGHRHHGGRPCFLRFLSRCWLEAQERGQRAESRDSSEMGTGRAPRRRRGFASSASQPWRTGGWFSCGCRLPTSVPCHPGTYCVLGLCRGPAGKKKCMPLWGSRSDQEEVISNINYVSCQVVIREHSKREKGVRESRDEGCRVCYLTF